MPSAKEAAREIVERLPEIAEVDEIMYRLYVLDKIRKGRSAIHP